MKNLYWITLLLLVVTSCDNNVLPPEPDNDTLNLETYSGSGSFLFDNYVPLQDKPVRVYYHIPENADLNTSILIALPGAGRNGAETRNILLPYAEEKSVILLVPQFSTEFYNGSNSYNLGNMYSNGSSPSTSTLHKQETWSFSLIRPIFDYVRGSLNSARESYDLLGFSAGAQFVHRSAIFLDDPVGQVAVCSPGWYTALDTSVNFPYGLKSSPVDISKLSKLVRAPWIIAVGDRDNDPNAPSLRRNGIVDKQGTNRLDRAHFFYDQAETLAKEHGVSFGWTKIVVPNVSHDLAGLAQSVFDQLYP